ncbi:hypothetical protein MKW94_012190 [Papaver nudicaule]|uniref:RRM domain-containing protein n=1 Tax=Papaver nudicaule TaxID=74823 RepID=A0AA42B5D6_PAPNU|nr:hypothetical protein [Papaver nudicaule]MCL7051061.1 hypothetical protein [Papaver nudicaule]
MNSGGYTVEVTSLSPNATEKDVRKFFAFSGKIEQVEIVRSGEYACTAYVTFKDPRSLEIAVLLSGARIVDQRVCITPWGYTDQFEFWNRPTWKIDDETVSKVHATHADQYVSTPAGEAVTRAQEVVVTMLLKVYVRGKDALVKAIVSTTRRTATAVAHAVVNSTYFSQGALWVSSALTRAAKAAADLGTPASKN